MSAVFIPVFIDADGARRSRWKIEIDPSLIPPIRDTQVDTLAAFVRAVGDMEIAPFEIEGRLCLTCTGKGDSAWTYADWNVTLTIYRGMMQYNPIIGNGTTPARALQDLCATIANLNATSPISDQAGMALRAMADAL